MKIIKDYKAYNNNSRFPRALVNIIFYVNVNYRLAHFFYRIKLFPIAKIFWLINRIFFNLDIDPRARIGGGFIIKHGLGIVIGAYAEIGENFKIYQGVTIGGNMGKTRKFNEKILHMPLIGNNVIASPNAVILGPIIIQDNSVLGAASVVTKDVEKGSIIVGTNQVLRIK